MESNSYYIDLINAYCPEQGDMTFADAYMLAVQRDEFAAKSLEEDYLDAYTY